MFDFFSPFKNIQYRLFFAAHSVALLGTGLSTIALALFAYNLDNSRAAEIISFALAAKMVAYVFIAPIVGGYAHKLPRKYLMIVFDLVRMGLLFSLPWVTEAWHIYIVIFMINACSAGFTPLYQATLPTLFNDDKDYSKALSLSRIVYDVENLLSPTLAAILLLNFDFSILFQINAAGFLVSTFILALVVYPKQLLSERKSGIWHTISFGSISYLRTPRLRGLLVFNFIAALIGALIIVNSANYAQNIFAQSTVITALLFGSVGVGAIMMSFILPKLLSQYSIRNLMKYNAVFAIFVLCGFYILPNLTGLFILWFFVGMISTSLQTPSGLVVKSSATQGDEPAYFSAHFTLTHLGWLVAYLIAGQIGSHLSIIASMFILAAITFICLIIALKFWQKDELVSLKHSHDAMDHEHPHIHDEHHQHDHEGWEGPEPHIHPHYHQKIKHEHDFHIDEHHFIWPNKTN